MTQYGMLTINWEIVIQAATILGVIWLHIEKNRITNTTPSLELHHLPKRKAFSQSVKDTILLRQANSCKRCLEYIKPLEFHHKNGDRSNNKLWNCESLCPNCHAKITRKK
jgi:5-methylcytosine-specific restriction endonuclease McrA